MRTFAPIVRILLCVMLLAILLASCGEQDATPTGTPSEPATQPTDAQPQIPPSVPEEIAYVPIPAQNVLHGGNPESLSEWVFTNYEQTFSWRDEVGNFCSVSVSLPAIAPVADFAIAFNEAMHETGTAFVEETVDCQQSGCSNFMLSISYEAYLNGDILSILLIEETTVDYTMYTAYSFDLEDGKTLSTADLCEELLDMDYPSFILASNAIAAHRFTEQYGGYIEGLQNQYVSTDSYFETEPTTDVDLYNEQLSAIPYDTMNINARGLFLGENGEIMLIYNAPSLAGADSYPTVIPFDVRVTDWQQPDEAYAYGQLFSLTDYVDGAYADAYSSILLRAFLADSEDFVHHAAKTTDNRQSFIVSSLNYALLPEQLAHFSAECRDVLDDTDITPDEKALAEQLLALTCI